MKKVEGRRAGERSGEWWGAGAGVVIVSYVVGILVNRKVRLGVHMLCRSCVRPRTGSKNEAEGRGFRITDGSEVVQDKVNSYLPRGRVRLAEAETQQRYSANNVKTDHNNNSSSKKPPSALLSSSALLLPSRRQAHTPLAKYPPPPPQPQAQPLPPAP